MKKKVRVLSCREWVLVLRAWYLSHYTLTYKGLGICSFNVFLIALGLLIMGAACCCLMVDCEEFANPNSSTIRNCICLRCFPQNFLHLYASLFHRGEQHALSSSTHGTSLSSTASLDNSVADIYRSPPRPLPYDADPRYLRLQRDGLISRREKGSSHSHEETEPLRASEEDVKSELSSKKSKWNEFSCEEGSEEYSSKLSLKKSTSKSVTGFAHIYTSVEDEDVCPTCLDEYVTENPKIIMKCYHHFHLGCIYEWMERSDNCPVCGQVMAFDETS